MKENLKDVRGRIINIQHFSTDDGPGIRTVVFFKGCPLDCAWCHNPETKSGREELFFRTDRCRACGACLAACPENARSIDGGVPSIDREKCRACGLCAEICPFGAPERVGGEVSVGEILAELERDRVFLERSGGGLTLSGGEPTAQPSFASALLSAARETGLHTCIESCGFCSRETLARLLPDVDLFLYDWKITDEREHIRYTGVSNRQIAENLAFLSDSGARVILRCPMIPDVNINEEHLLGIARLAREMRAVEAIELMPYHPMGIGKASALGAHAAYDRAEFLEASELTEALDFIRARTDKPVRMSGK